MSFKSMGERPSATDARVLVVRTKLTEELSDGYEAAAHMDTLGEEEGEGEGAEAAADGEHGEDEEAPREGWAYFETIWENPRYGESEMPKGPARSSRISRGDTQPSGSKEAMQMTFSVRRSLLAD